jgi:tetratricopeptide (TPR) repeat protein
MENIWRTILVQLVVAGMAQAGSWTEDLLTAKRLREEGNSEAADSAIRGVVARAKQMDPHAPATGVALNSMGRQLYLAARYAEAEAVYRMALEAFDAPGPETSLNRALTAGNLGVLLRAQGRYREAESRLAESVKQLEALQGPDSLNYAVMASNLGSVYWALGDLAKAEALVHRADAIFDQSKATDSRRGNRQILASIYVAQQRYQDAEELLRALLEGASDQQAASIYNNLTAAALGRGEYVLAEERARSAVELARRALPAAHPVLAACLNNLAQALRFQGRYLEAERLYRDALEVWEQVHGDRHPDVAKGLINLGAFYHERGREAGAEDLYLRGAAIFEQAYGAHDPRVLAARNELAEVLRAERRYTESEKLARATLPLLEQALQPGDPVLVRALSNWARLLNETKRAAEAADVLERIRLGKTSFR